MQMSSPDADHPADAAFHLYQRPSHDKPSVEPDVATPESPASERKENKRSGRQGPPPLKSWTEMPRHLQFNPYILTGYRPQLTLWGSLKSLSYVHNETVNIITHALPIIYILLTVPDLLPWTNLGFLSWCHFLGILCPWVGSCAYHLFMNMERGPVFYNRLLQIDMLGIWISQSFGALPMVTATTYCLPKYLRFFCICTYCLLSLWGLFKAMSALSPWERRLCFSLPFIMRLFMWVLRASSYGGGEPSAFSHIILQDAVSISGATIGAMHVPEKWFPGAVDYYLNSHNIMHVMVVAAVYSMHSATMRDLAWMQKINCQAVS